VPVHQRAKLYVCHTEKDTDDFQTLTGKVAPNDGGFELKNLSGKNRTVTQGESAIALASNDTVRLTKGMSINFGGASAETSAEIFL
jgi:hypothetical protein